jgi:hypothetical protein
MQNYERAQSYLNKAFRSFTSDWSSLSSLSYHERKLKLFGLQRLNELQIVLDIVKSPAKREAFEALFRNWISSDPEVSRLPLPEAPLSVWDDLVSYRLTYVNFAEKLVGSAFPKDFLNKVRCGLATHLSQAACDLRNDVLYDRWMKFGLSVSRFTLCSSQQD